MKLISMRNLGLLGALVLLSGCDEPVESTNDATDTVIEDTALPSLSMLISHRAWRPVDDPAADPFIDSKPDGAECVPILGYGEEAFAGQSSFFVDTKICDYLTVEQETLAPIQRGDAIFLRVFHSELLADPPAEAWLTVHIGDNVLWDARIAMPADASVLTPEIVADFDAPVGSRAVYHVQNHGANAYHLLEVAVIVEEGSP